MLYFHHAKFQILLSLVSSLPSLFLFKNNNNKIFRQSIPKFILSAGLSHACYFLITFLIRQWVCKGIQQFTGLGRNPLDFSGEFSCGLAFFSPATFSGCWKASKMSLDPSRDSQLVASEKKNDCELHLVNNNYFF